jgi:hypothetical protein
MHSRAQTSQPTSSKREVQQQMSHLSSIGFPVHSLEDFKALAERIYERGEVIPATKGLYVGFTDSSGAELYVQQNKGQQLTGMNPHFQGQGRLKVCLTRTIERKGNDLDGALYGWADPTKDDDPDSGQYPFVFDVPDFYAFETIKFPSTINVQIAAFAHQLSLYASEQAFYAAKSDFAVESFIPSGLFTPEMADIDPPRAHAIFTGRILAFEEKRNGFTSERFYWLLVKTLGGTADVVIDPKEVDRPPHVGGIASGSFWLSGRLVR